MLDKISSRGKTYANRQTARDGRVSRDGAEDVGAVKAELWQAVQRAFSEQRLTRRVKEALAFAVSVTSRSAFGTAFHLAQMRRLGVSERGVMEVLGVTQMFSSYTKSADTLQLEPDMHHIAPVDWSPAPHRR